VIGLTDLVRSESEVQVDHFDIIGGFMSPCVAWEREDLGVFVTVRATRQLKGDWDVYASISAFWNGGGSCIGESVSELCEKADIEGVAAAALQVAMTKAVDTPFLGPIEKLRWLAALGLPPNTC
jgi:hypothetical protein